MNILIGKYRCFLSVFALLLFCTTFAVAQVDEISTEILKPFKAQLAVSNKRFASPLLPPLDTNTSRLEYNVPEHVITVKYPAPNLRPIAMSGEEPTPSSVFYLKAGFGYPISPNLEFSYHNKKNKNLKFSSNFKHLSSQGNQANQVFGNTHFDLNGTYFLKNGLAVGAKLGVNIDEYRFFGYHQLPDTLGLFPDSIEVPKDSVLQNFTEVFGNIHCFNGTINSMQLNYKADIDFHYLTDKYKATEFVFAPRIEVEKWLGSSKNKHRIFAGLNLNSATFSKDSSNSRFLVGFNPGIDLNFGIFKARAAVNLGSSEQKFFVFPDIKLNLEIADGKFGIYAGWSGQIKTNTFRGLSRYNPFISSSLNLRHTRHSEIFGGLTGSLRNMGFDLRAAYTFADNLPVFMNDSAQNYLRFNVLYNNFRILNFRGSLDFNLIKNLTIGATASYNLYMGENDAIAYQLPVLETNFTVKYQLKQLILKSEIYFNAGVPYKEILSNENKMLNGLFDINFSASYWIGKKKQNFGLFAEINNILNNKNERWYLYPQIGFNARAGILLKF